MDIGNFMSWFIQQVIRIFTFTYNTLNNITFGGTSLLKIIIFINVIIPLLKLLITVVSGSGFKEAAEEAGVNSGRATWAKKNEDVIWWEDTKGNRHYK